LLGTNFFADVAGVNPSAKSNDWQKDYEQRIDPCKQAPCSTGNQNEWKQEDTCAAKASNQIGAIAPLLQVA
jgi:hypothetical protein